MSRAVQAHPVATSQPVTLGRSEAEAWLQAAEVNFYLYATAAKAEDPWHRTDMASIEAIHCRRITACLLGALEALDFPVVQRPDLPGELVVLGDEPVQRLMALHEGPRSPDYPRVLADLRLAVAKQGHDREEPEEA